MRRIWFWLLLASCSVEEIDDRVWQPTPVGLHSEALTDRHSSAQLVLEGNEVSFTLGDDRIATIGVKNTGEEKLSWQMTLDSKDDLVYIMPTYDDMTWLEVRKKDDEEWILLENKGNDDKVDVFASGELQNGEIQWLEFRVVDPNTGWYQFHDKNIFHPYHFTKTLQFTDLESKTTTKLTANLYLPELKASPLEINLTAENTEEWVIVENFGMGDLRWNIEPLLPEGAIYAIAVAHNGQDEQGRFYGEGKVLIGIDAQLLQGDEQQVFQFDYMGGATVSPEAVSVVVNFTSLSEFDRRE